MGEKGYAGTDNLVAMQAAANYNNCLQNMIYAVLTSGRWDWKDIQILDFGAGLGQFAIPVTTLFSSKQVCAVENDPALQSRLEAAGVTVKAALSEVADESIDLVYSFNVLEHIEEDNAVLQEIYRKTSWGGGLLLYVPAFPCLYSEMDRKVGHYRRYRKRALVQQVKTAGFEVEEAFYMDSLGFLASLAYNMIGESSGNLTERSVRLYDKGVFPLSRRLDRFTSPFMGKNLVITGYKTVRQG